MPKKEKQIYIITIIIILLLSLLKIYKCPFKYIFGISCPFCGMTRAFISLIKFEIAKSFYYHLLWPLVLIILIIYTLIELKIIKIKKKIIYILLYVFCIINLIYYFYRLFNNSNIVYFDFKKSLINKIIVNFF